MSEVTSMLNPFNPHGFNAHPISNKIKSPRNKGIELLEATGVTLIKEYDVFVDQKLELQGMGETTARKRRKGEDDKFYKMKFLGYLKDPNDDIEIEFSYDPFEECYYAKKKNETNKYKQPVNIGKEETFINRLGKIYNENDIKKLIVIANSWA